MIWVSCGSALSWSASQTPVTAKLSLCGCFAFHHTPTTAPTGPPTRVSTGWAHSKMRGSSSAVPLVSVEPRSLVFHAYGTVLCTASRQVAQKSIEIEREGLQWLTFAPAWD